MVAEPPAASAGGRGAATGGRGGATGGRGASGASDRDPSVDSPVSPGEPVETAVLVPYDRLHGWTERFSARHGQAIVTRSGTRVTWTSPDGAIATYEDEPPLEDFGIVLVRRGGYAVGRVEDGRLVAHKTGTRYVQGRTKAGGWSQQRYARRRANQADALAGSAADHVVRLVPGDLRIAGGGDRALVAQVLTAADRTLDPGLRWLEVKEPRLASLERAVRDVRSYAVVLNEAARAR